MYRPGLNLLMNIIFVFECIKNEYCFVKIYLLLSKYLNFVHEFYIYFTVLVLDKNLLFHSLITLKYQKCLTQ